MKTCPNCGTQMADEAKFCESCGVSLEQGNPGIQGAQPVDNAQSAPNNGPIPTQMPPAQTQYNPYQQYYNPKDHTSEFDVRDIADNKLFAAFAYIFGVLGIIAALLVNNSPFTRFHAKQAVKLEIAAIVLVIPAVIPFLGWFVTCAGLLVLVVVKIIAVVNALNGKAIEAPIVSEIGVFKG
ncbi:DUF4870 domain-containing protein [Butyrivibrio sp. XB500-5]|uniref:DUF4870 domain-containing protein n=1 Tax=Butyrivibrio sp. XB500-5 TaxID=2364880 RepID=UPI001314B8B5|nr:zinc ribbon domain-containing protein [Butyrivibrio sp. XB500-5]